MPILELSDASGGVGKGVAAGASAGGTDGVGRGCDQRRRSGCRMREPNCDVSASSATWNGTRCQRANAKISLTIFCTRIVHAENSGDL